MKYIQITQDGVGRLIYEKTLKELVGLYTEGLDTCVAVIFFAENGITLIHATGKLDEEAIYREYNLLQNVTSWAIAFNPVINPSWSDDVKRFKPELSNRCKNFQVYACANGSVMVNRAGIVTTNFIPNSLSDLLAPKDLDKRHRANILNNLLLLDDELMQPDIQYDGDSLLGPPALSKTPEQMYAVLQTKKFTNIYEPCFGNFMFYLLVYRPDLYEEAAGFCAFNHRDIALLSQIKSEVLSAILKIYKVNDIEKAFRRAAGFGHVQHLSLMLEFRPGIINSIGPTTRRSALHIAVLEKKIENTRFLLANGADAAFQDRRGKTAREYAEQSENTELIASFDGLTNDLGLGGI